ncbi:MAG: hypothetical protein JNM18_17105 [Planctomycetaceae bacterium]|nr:hypothetical protein [Planctomycetaceae bacterium]
MAADIYETCLGIAPGKRPPNYYELLGLPPFTNEPPVIAEAVDAAKLKLKPFLASSQAMEATRLLCELELARKILLNAASRKDYEQSLRAPATAANAPPSTTPAALPPVAQAPVAAPPQAAPAQAMPVQAAPMQAMPVQAMPVQAVPMQAMPLQAAPMSAMPMSAMPMQAMPVQAVPMAGIPTAGGHVPMATVAPPANVNPFGGAVQANSSVATKANYRRKKRGQNALAFQLGGVVLCAALGLGIYANWDTIKPKPVYKVDKPVVAQGPLDPLAKPDLSKLNPNYGKSSSPPPAVNPTKPVSSETMAEINRKLDAIANSPAMPPRVTLDNPTPETMPKTTTPAKTDTPAKTTPTPSTPTTPEPTKPKEGTKADAKEAAAVKKQLDEARAALRTLKADKAVEALDLALLEATADDSNAAIERMKKLVEANQKFWESAVAGAQSLKAADELKAGDELLATVTEVDENKAMVKFEERNQALLFKSPDKWPAKLLVACAEKALGKGSEAANVAIASYLMIDPKGDRDQAKQLLEAAGAAGAPLLEELNAGAK